MPFKLNIHTLQLLILFLCCTTIYNNTQAQSTRVKGSKKIAEIQKKKQEKLAKINKKRDDDKKKAAKKAARKAKKAERKARKAAKKRERKKNKKKKWFSRFRKNKKKTSPKKTPIKKTPKPKNKPTKETWNKPSKPKPKKTLPKDDVPIKDIELVHYAKQFIGVPYRWGGETPKGFDCSGFTQYVFKNNGIQLPRTSRQQIKVGKKIRMNKVKAGDLLFFDTDGKGVVSHVGIVTSVSRGLVKMIHASPRGIEIATVTNSNYWMPRFKGAKKVIQ